MQYTFTKHEGEWSVKARTDNPNVDVLPESGAKVYVEKKSGDLAEKVLGERLATSADGTSAVYAIPKSTTPTPKQIGYMKSLAKARNERISSDALSNKKAAEDEIDRLKAIPPMSKQERHEGRHPLSEDELVELNERSGALDLGETSAEDFEAFRQAQGLNEAR